MNLYGTTFGRINAPKIIYFKVQLYLRYEVPLQGLCLLHPCPSGALFNARNDTLKKSPTWVRSRTSLHIFFRIVDPGFANYMHFLDDLDATKCVLAAPLVHHPSSVAELCAGPALLTAASGRRANDLPPPHLV